MYIITQNKCGQFYKFELLYLGIHLYIKLFWLKNNTSAFITKIYQIRLIEWICLFIIAAVLSIRIAYIFSYDTDLEGMEMISVHITQLLHLKSHMYSNPSQFPYLLLAYTPLYYYVMDLIMRIFSIDVINDTHTIYIIGRSISFLLFIFVAYGIYAIIKQIHSGFRHYILLLLLFILLLPKHFYTVRPDSFKVFFFTLFILFHVKYLFSQKHAYFWLSLFCLITGIYFKHDLLLYGFIYYAVFFLSYRDKKNSYAGFIILIVLLISVYLMYLSTGINLFVDLLVYNIQYDSGIHTSFLFIAFNLIRTSLLILLSVRNVFSNDKFTRTIAIVSICFVAASNTSMLRVGSNINYTYESVLLLLINAVLFLKESDFQYKVLFTTAYFLFLLALPINYYLYKYSFKNEAQKEALYYNNLRISKEIKKIIKNDVVFFPNMKYMIFFSDCRIIYGYDWHYDRFSDLYYHVKLKPKFLINDIIRNYDNAFKTGVVQYIIIDNEPKSLKQLSDYYPAFTQAVSFDSLLVCKYLPNAVVLK